MKIHPIVTGLIALMIFKLELGLFSGTWSDVKGFSPAVLFLLK
jgi:hypothetical protein